MTFPPWALGAYGAVALLSAAGWIFGAGRTKSYAANVLIIALTCFVAHFLVTGFTQKKIGRTNAAVAVEAGEMQMRLVACFDSVRRHGFKADKAASEAKRGETESKQRKEAFDLNEKSLNEAVAANPQNPEFPAKLIILLGANRTPEHIQRIKELDKQLADMKGTVHDTTHLALVLKSLYETQESVVSDVQLRDYRGVITKQIPQGWYQDQAIERLLELQPDKQQLQTFRDEVDTRNITMFVKFCFLVVLIVLAGLIGIINAFIQIGMTAAKPAKQLDEVELPVPLKSVYAVFVTWFSIQILVSTAGHLILAKHPEISQQPNTVALLTMLTYLISNLPGPLLIYFIALKPKGVQPGDFFRELRIRFRTSTASPPKILFMGWLAWCTAIPIVLACAYAASKIFHTQSSDNPVISQIIQIANATDPLAVIIFYFTLGVMAPFFEEILFRGFMFAALKPRIGSLLAMLLSAATFAVMHFDKGGALMLFAIGFIFAFTFNRTRSLVPSMIAHGLWNAGTFTLVLTLFGT